MIEENKLKVHLGCGKRYLPGYIHVDLDKHPHDIRSLEMFEDNSVDEIYTCGTFEYFDRIDEVSKVLNEWKRVLKLGGILRISVPDFEGVVQVYDKYREIEGIGILGPIFGRIEINSEKGKKVLFQKTIYDFENLKKVLEKAGFINVKRYDWKKFFPKGYDDYSAAYVPHKDPNGIALGLNVTAEKFV